LHQAQDTAGDEAADRPAHGAERETSATSKPRNRKAEATASFEAAVTKEMGIDDAVGNREAETRHKKVGDLFPHVFGVGFFHGPVQN
jgi:hypothetical protein